MKYKDIKIVEAEPQSVLGGTPVGRICFGLKQSSRPVTSWRNKSMMIKGAEEFIKRYPEHEAEIRACMTKYGLGGNKGTGSGSSDKGTGSGSGDKGTGSGSGDKGVQVRVVVKVATVLAAVIKATVLVLAIKTVKEKFQDTPLLLVGKAAVLTKVLVINPVTDRLNLVLALG